MAALAATACMGTCAPAVVPRPTSLVVTFPETAASDRPLLLFSGQRDGACRSYEAFIGTPSVTLPNASYDPTCPVEIDVFAPGFGAYARQTIVEDPHGADWYTGALAAGTIAIALPVRAPAVHVWIVADAGSRAKANDVYDVQRDAALWPYDEMGPGMALTFTTSDLSDAALGLPDCARSSEISSDPSLYQGGVLNVYLVAGYLNQMWPNFGQNCRDEGHPEMSFVSWNYPNVPGWSDPRVKLPDGTLAHELGHAFGLYHPDGGHTNDVAHFDWSNLMWTSVGVVLNVSVGQSYDINFSTDAWLNRPGASSSGPAMHTCQDAWGTGICPALDLFVSGWPP